MSSMIQADQSLPNVGKPKKDSIVVSVLERNQSDLESPPVISDPVNSGVEPDTAHGDTQDPTNVKPVLMDAGDVALHPDLAQIASPQETVENTEAPNGSPTDTADKTEASNASPINTADKDKAFDMSKPPPAEDTAASDAQALDPTSEEPKPEREPETMMKWPRYVDFEGFKNVYNSKDKRHVLDVLLTGTNYMYEVRRVHTIRKWLQQFETAEERKRSIASISSGPTSEKEHTRISRVRIQSPGVIFHLANVTGETWTTSVPRTFARPFQVFIYFQPRMKETLAKLKARLEHKKESDSGAAKATASDHIMSTTVIEPLPREGTGAFQVDDDEDNFETDAKQNPDMYNEETLGAMQCYIDFVDEKIMPLYHEYDGTSKTKIRFEDLFHLFRMGDLVYASPSSDMRPDRRYETNLSQSSLLWKIYTLNNPSIKGYPSFEALRHRRKPRGYQDDEDDDDDDDENSNPTKAFRVWAYYIDHDGTSYGPVKHCFNIAPFEGEMEIAALPCYPARFVDDPDLVKTLQHEGAKFRDCITKRHLSYDGWTASSMPMGEPIALDKGGEKTKSPEYIESHVIVDFAETFQVYPFWKPAFHEAKAYRDGGWSDESDEYGIYDIETDNSFEEILQRDDGVTMWLRKDFLEHDRFFNDYKAHVAPTKPGKEKKGIELKDEDLVLLPRRIFAYILRDRKFSVLDVRFLDFIQPQQEVFSQLKIPRQYKDIVKGLVSSHFVRKKLEREFSNLSTADKLDVLQSSGALSAADVPQTPDEGHGMGTAEITGAATHGLTQDFIQGKGRGLVVLLHGVPGVGKTATAEAVALENRKPLFVITCGDLGLAPTDVETHLTEVFRLAHLWDCVLLLDEADVFLAARSNYDLNRNALVSVFLRVLEYYSGILFLTTNRVGTLDEAFKSRIHISLYYPSLRRTQAVKIFEVNIARLKKIAATRSLIAKEPQLMIDEVSIVNFAHSLFAKAEAQGEREWTPWNGRQIRNAFQIASALAYNHMHNEYAKLLKSKERGEIQHAECPTPILNAQHFKVVDTVTDEFDSYMYEARGKSDASRAHLSGERADDLPANSDLGLPGIGYTRTSAVRLPPRTPESYRSHGPAESQAYLDSGPVSQRHRADALREPPRGSAHHHYEGDSRLDEDYRAKRYPSDSTPDYDNRGQNVSRARVLDPDSTRFAREERSVGDSFMTDSVASLRRDRSPHKFMRDSVSSLNQERYNRFNPPPALDSRPLARGQHHDQFIPPSPSPQPTAGALSLFDHDNMDDTYD